METDEQKVKALQQALNVSPVICRLLVQRGIHTYDLAKSYYRPQLTDLHDPWQIKNMQKAVERIVDAIENNEKILLFGDYDVDGTTSVALMYKFLSTIYDKEKIEFYIPHRYREGYGISKRGVEFAIDNDFRLVISLDCGIKSFDLIAYANTRGIDFIVCDHHLPDPVLPPAVAILNPKQKDCEYPFKDLCGCGVAYKLITALAQYLNLPASCCHCYLDLVATAIAADIVPINGENRVLAFYGLKNVNENP